jgi:type I restriction enzyme S subunit
MKDSGIEWIGEIPTHWNAMRLRSKFYFGKGLPITKADLRDSGISVISYGQIHSKHNIGTTIKPELIRYVDTMYLETNASSLVNNGDFIFADTSEDLSGCGNCVYVDTDYPLFAGYHTMILRSVENTSSKYYSYLFATDAWRSQIRAQASGVKLFSITQKMLRDALLIEPSEEEKVSIVSFLDDMCSTTNTIIASNEATIEKLKEYRQSVIYEAVTGKVEI